MCADVHAADATPPQVQAIPAVRVGTAVDGDAHPPSFLAQSSAGSEPTTPYHRVAKGALAPSPNHQHRSYHTHQQQHEQQRHHHDHQRHDHHRHQQPSVQPRQHQHYAHQPLEDGGGNAADRYDPSVYADQVLDQPNAHAASTPHRGGNNLDSTQDSTSISHGSWHSGSRVALAAQHPVPAAQPTGQRVPASYIHDRGDSGGGDDGGERLLLSELSHLRSPQTPQPRRATPMKQRPRPTTGSVLAAGGNGAGREFKGKTRESRRTSLPHEWNAYCGVPLSTARLHPIRHEHSGVALGIDADGTVYLDQRASNINASGSGGTLFSVAGDGESVAETTTTAESRTSRREYQICEGLPDDLHAKYDFLAEFVQILRTRTRKVAYSTDVASFELMEDGTSFDAHFAAGHSVSVVGNGGRSSNTAAAAAATAKAELKSGERFAFTLGGVASESNGAGASAGTGDGSHTGSGVAGIPDLASGWLDTAGRVEIAARRGYRLCKMLELVGNQSELEDIFPIVAGKAATEGEVTCSSAVLAAGDVVREGTSSFHPPLRFIAGVGWGCVATATGETSLFSLDGTAVHLNAAATELAILFPGQPYQTPTVCSLKPDAVIPDRIYPLIASLAKVVEAFRSV